MHPEHQANILRNVEIALQEDIGTGDITAQLIPSEKKAKATVISREKAILCGTEWVDTVFKEISNELTVIWAFKDGDTVQANDTLFTLQGPARAILTGERSALNFLQTLSGTATTSHYYANLVAHT